MNLIRTVGAKTLGFIQALGSVCLFLLQILAHSGTSLLRFRLSVRQVYFAGELGPVLAAILFASSAGGAMTSEIGLMKATEQLEAMNVMAVNPVARVVAPRFWAGVFSMPLLASIFNVAGIYGAYLVGVQWLGLDGGIFWSQMQNNISFGYDVLNGLIKSAFFGVAVTLIAVHQGFHALPTSEGILRASTRTVVSSALVVLAIDFILTAFMFTA